MVDVTHDPTWVYVGTQRSGPGTGLSRGRLDVQTGRLTTLELAAVTSDPAYFVVHPHGHRLYTCNSGTPGGVSALAIDAQSGDLSLLDHYTCEGRGPSQLSLDETGRFVLAANYGGGYVEVLALDQEGRLDRSTAFVRHQGRSVHPERQDRPHVHCVRAAPGNRFALVADLGLDRIVVYRFDGDRGTLTPHGHADALPGSGPRHLAWHPDGRTVFVVDELTSSVTAWAWNGEAGTLGRTGTWTVLPREFTGENTSAEIVVHPNGRALYVSNRGHDSVAACVVDPGTGTCTVSEIVDARGRMPRYMTLDGTGRWLLVASHDSDSISVFDAHEGDGQLNFVTTAAAPRPYGIAVRPGRRRLGG